MNKHGKANEPDWLRECFALGNLQGDVRLAQGDLSGALQAYGESLTVRRRLGEADPSNAGWQRDLSYSLTVVAQIHKQQARGLKPYSSRKRVW